MNMIALKEMEDLQSNESALEFRSFAVQLEEANEEVLLADRLTRTVCHNVENAP